METVNNMQCDQRILIKVYELHYDLLRDEKEDVFVWVPGHSGIRCNSAADSVAKDSLDGDGSDELIPFSDLNLA